MSVSTLLIVLAVPLLALAFQAIAFRILLRRGMGSGGKQKVSFLCIVASAVTSLTAVVWLDRGNWQSFWQSFLFVGIGIFCVGHVYFHFFNMSETARRIRILVTLSGGGKINQNESDGGYHPDFLVKIRIKRLLDLGTIRPALMPNQMDAAIRYTARWSPLTIAAYAMKWHEKLLFPNRKQAV